MKYFCVPEFSENKLRAIFFACSNSTFFASKLFEVKMKRTEVRSKDKKNVIIDFIIVHFKVDLF